MDRSGILKEVVDNLLAVFSNNFDFLVDWGIIEKFKIDSLIVL